MMGVGAPEGQGELWGRADGGGGTEPQNSFAKTLDGPASRGYNRNMPAATQTPVAHITLTAPVTVRMFSETASRDRDVEVPAGTYDIVDVSYQPSSDGLRRFAVVAPHGTVSAFYGYELTAALASGETMFGTRDGKWPMHSIVSAK